MLFRSYRMKEREKNQCNDLESVGPTHEDACVYKEVDGSDPKGGLATHGISHHLGKHMWMSL